MNEATLADTDTGKIVEGPGWFIVNVAEISWESVPDGGIWCSFEADDAPNGQVGIGVHVLRPGEANGRYHAESDQEGFLVLSGECIAVVEGEERRLRQWDYLHCPPGTYHITVGAGEVPCAILMMGARSPGKTIHYPVDPVAARHGASVARETSSPKEAYADLPRTFTRVRAPWPSRD
ncbi:MAG: cupin domain-containing protein [Actinobacteria bacterium]|nr:cupin domain-containing protein [Actinomycetota bacterium]